MKILTVKKWLIILIACLTAYSCSDFIKAIDDEPYQVINVQDDYFGIAFSGNINGETHPCGCRHFPLGGLPHVAGVMHELKQDADILYVDAGDTFFPSSTLPVSLKDSLTFAAKNLAKGLAQVGLKYFVPGDQDFAAGANFLKELLDESGIQMLVANLKDPKSFPHKTWIKITKGSQIIFITGLVDSIVLPSQFQYLFTTPEIGFQAVLEEMKNNGYDPKSKFHRLIVVSNAGMGPDKAFAKNNPMIDWIIGSHSQSFTNIPDEEGKTQLVQVLSRNHYVGEVKFSLKTTKKDDKYKIHEVRQDKGKLLTPNPFFSFIDQHKTQLTKLQAEEQARSIVQGTVEGKLNTASSCIDCHDDQGKKWKSTAHALAFVTLVNNKEEFNLSCIKCHSVGLNDKKGFSKAVDLISIPTQEKPDKEESKDNKDNKKKISQEDHYKSYVAAMKKAFGNIKSVRKLSPKVLHAHAEKILEIENSRDIAHNFSSVQCLNCHDQHTEHPFEPSGYVKVSAKAMTQNMKEKCMDCHDPDQSPEWYKDNQLNMEVYSKNLKKVACPKRQEDY
jgi:hypothetical protein